MRARLITLFFTWLAGLGITRRWPLHRRIIGRYRAWRGKSVPRYPVVLAHGLFGFDELSIAGQRHTYFRGIVEHLRAKGIDVYTPRVDPSANIAQRAAQLAAQVRAIPARRVNIIGHSMGGLDARYAITRLGLDAHVSSLVTIGTPHYGTPLADHGTWLGNRMGLSALLRLLGCEVGAFENLTTAHLAAFNAEVLDKEQVFYASVVGRAAPSTRMHRLMQAPRKVLDYLEGDNDGLVPVSSQVWGQVLLNVEACHLAQIGWLPSYDPAAIFDPLMRDLTLEGC